MGAGAPETPQKPGQPAPEPELLLKRHSIARGRSRKPLKCPQASGDLDSNDEDYQPSYDSMSEEASPPPLAAHPCTTPAHLLNWNDPREAGICHHLLQRHRLLDRNSTPGPLWHRICLKLWHTSWPVIGSWSNVSCLL